MRFIYLLFLYLTQGLEHWMSESKHGVILFSFGSLIRGSTLPPKRLEAILKVFARLPQRIVWKWETEDIAGLPENVLVLKWLPQYDLLRKYRYQTPQLNCHLSTINFCGHFMYTFN